MLIKVFSAKLRPRTSEERSALDALTKKENEVVQCLPLQCVCTRAAQLSGCYTLIDAIGAAWFSFPPFRCRPSPRLVRSANDAFLSTRRPMLPAMSNAGWRLEKRPSQDISWEESSFQARFHLGMDLFTQSRYWKHSEAGNSLGAF